jgi:hypothetical protein
VSVVQYDDTISQGYGVVYKTALNSLTITGTYSVGASTYGALTGEIVWKVGATTGTTNGRVTATCVDVRVINEPGVLCAQAGTYHADHGDSGSPVYMPYDPGNPNFTPRWVGILFAGDGTTTYHSTWNSIVAAQSYQFFW